MGLSHPRLSGTGAKVETTPMYTHSDADSSVFSELRPYSTSTFRTRVLSLRKNSTHSFLISWLQSSLGGALGFVCSGLRALPFLGYQAIAFGFYGLYGARCGGSRRTGENLGAFQELRRLPSTPDTRTRWFGFTLTL